MRSSHHQVNHFTADCPEEVEKIMQHYQGHEPLEIAVRVKTPNNKASVNLSEKFGCSLEQAAHLLKYIESQGIRAGLSMHLGSQNEDETTYAKWVDTLAKLIEKSGVTIHTINIGGGIPVMTNFSIKSNADLLISYLQKITHSLRDKILDKISNAHDAKIIIEPGRSMVGTAVDLLVAIVGIKQVEDRRVLAIDDGVFTSFSDSAFHNWEYTIRAIDENGQEVKGRQVSYQLNGRTCDSADCIKSVFLPENLKATHHLWVPNAGAYMSSQATSFNGFEPHRYVYYNA
jgi:ornithine decarboxylase